MPRKTTILIVILAIITGILIFLAVRSDQTQNFIDKTLNNNTTPTQVVVQPYADLSFSPSILDVAKNPSVQTAEIVVNTNGKAISGVQVELSYDPRVFTNVKITKPKQSLLGPNPTVLFNSTDPAAGRVSYAVGIPLNGSEVIGNGPIATITFTANTKSGTPQGQINFLPKSSITTLMTASSVLRTSTPLQVILVSPSITP